MQMIKSHFFSKIDLVITYCDIKTNKFDVLFTFKIKSLLIKTLKIIADDIVIIAEKLVHFITEVFIFYFLKG